MCCSYVTLCRSPYTLYFVSSQDNNLNVDLPAENETSTIPAGYAAVSLRPGANVPRLFSHLLHGNYLVPRFIKQDLYNKIKTALENSGLEREGKFLYMPPKRIRVRFKVSTAGEGCRNQATCGRAHGRYIVPRRLGRENVLIHPW